MDESDSAYVGHGSGGYSASVTPEVELAFERAMATARENGMGSVTTEHVLVALLDEDSVREVLITTGVDLDAVRVDLLKHLESNESKEPTDTQPMADPALQSAMRRAVMKTFVSNRKAASGADLLTAILVEDNTVGSRILSDHGLTVDSAENEALEHYLARSVEQSKKLEELQMQLEKQRSNANEGDSTFSIAKSKTQHSDSGGTHKVYKLRVTADTGDSNIAFKAAISRNGQLDLYVEETPFEIEFVASTIVALFETVEAGRSIKVELITDVEGQKLPGSGFTGSSGAIFRDRMNPMEQRSGQFKPD